MGTTKKTFTILSIETSCDETAAAVLLLRRQNLPVFPPQDSSFSKKKFLARSKSDAKNTIILPHIQTLSSVVKSQIKLHSKMGGVVPEVAARAHVKNIEPAVKQALAESKLPLTAIDYIAVTEGPGLVPSLIVGIEFAKALSLATGIPVLPVNHMLGHLYSPFAILPPTTSNLQAKLFPQIALIVSGGHTMLVLMENSKKYKVLGHTVDDAAGEAFDKVAKLLKLPYPGGPEVSKLASLGKPTFAFPRPMIHSKDFNFSFAGLKTAVLYHVQSLQPTSYTLQAKQDICKAFEDAVVEVLLYKTFAAAKKYKAKSISLSGGVSANRKLRTDLQTACQKLGLTCFIPPFHLSTDNAEMIGMAAAFMLQNGKKPVPIHKIKADPNLAL